MFTIASVTNNTPADYSDGSTLAPSTITAGDTIILKDADNQGQWFYVESMTFADMPVQGFDMVFQTVLVNDKFNDLAVPASMITLTVSDSTGHNWLVTAHEMIFMGVLARNVNLVNGAA